MRRRVAAVGCIVWVALAGFCAWGGETIDLTEGWKFAPDPDDAGVNEGWPRPDFDDTPWSTIQSGQRWEDQGFPELDGVAWYRKRITIPETMKAPRIWLALGGINDSGIVYCNGERVAAFGDKETTSVAGTPVVADLTPRIRWGQENVIAVRVLDWGNSGGLASEPCMLTTDPAALPLQSLFRFVPGLDGRRSLVGVEPVALGLPPGARIRFSAAVNDGPEAMQDATTMKDRDGNSIAVAAFDLALKPGDRVSLTAQLPGSAGEKGLPLVLEKTYTWPELPRWPGRYRDLRVLNNFVTELRVADRVAQDSDRCEFLNPREGWVFVRIHGRDDTAAYLDDETEPLVWRKHPDTGDLEAMRYLGEGDHGLRLERAAGSRVDVRAVPEIAFCYWPTTTIMKTLPVRDRAFAERYIFPNTNTLLTKGKTTDREFASWLAEGRRWLSNSSLLGLDDETAPTVDSVYEDWAGNRCVTRPGYSGIIVDEFLSSPAAHYAAWTGAAERLHANPAFTDKKYYAWVVDTYRHKPGLEFMRRLYDLGGRFAWERYIHEEPTEEVAMLRLYEELGALEEWAELMPGLKERLLYCLGSFTIPWCSLNINPGTNYLPFMDRQFQVLATDPLFFGSRGIFQWAEHYTDDDALRYAQSLYRHYCIEGNRTPFGDFPYRLTHLANPDFADGLNGWRVESAGPDGVVAGEHRGLGKIQGRWTNIGTGDRCAVMVRTDSGPNRIAQTVKDLQSGRLYSMKFIAADLDNLGRNEEVGLWPTLEGADLEDGRTFRCVMPSSYALDLDGFNRENRAYTTYAQVMFRPRGTSVEVTFSDWKDGRPAGASGQRIGFNFVEIQPYFE